MLPLISAVFVASLLGSGHCAGMCGAFVAFAVDGDRARRGMVAPLTVRGEPVAHTASRDACLPSDVATALPSPAQRERVDRRSEAKASRVRARVAALLGRQAPSSAASRHLLPHSGRRDGGDVLRLSAAYNLGRLVTYSALGALAGLLGAALDLGGAALGIQRAALVAAGLFMIGFALVALARSLGARLPHVPLPSALRSAVAAGHRAALALPPVGRAATIGVLTPLLPCGWLYAFVVTAAGTGSALAGATTMAVFWLGTVPVLAALGLGIGAIGAPLRRRLPALTAILLACVGLWTLVGRAHVPALRTASATSAQRSDDPAAVERVQSLDARQMPCCDRAAAAEAGDP